jgi:hypothetical protein
MSLLMAPAALAEEAAVTPAPAEQTPPTGAPAVSAPTTSTTQPGEQSSVTTTTTTSTPAPEVKAQIPQAQTTTPAHRHHTAKSKGKHGGENATGKEKESEEEKAFSHHKKAPSPSVLTPALPSALGGSLGGVPDFFVNSFSIPPFLLPIYQAAGTAYGIPWQVLAAINEVETNYGRDLSISSAGAEGWMQFLPSSWSQYGLDVTNQGSEDPYNPADAIFAAARYLKAAGGAKNIRGAIFSYNHSQAYVNSVLMRAQLLGGTPPGLLGAITGLTEARFPVHAASHFSDAFQSIPAATSHPAQTLIGTTIYSQAGAPAIAVQDGVVTRIGDSSTLGHYISLRDSFGNTYTYAQLGSVAHLYPVLQLRSHTPAKRVLAQGAGPTPSQPASAGVQPRTLPASTVGSPLALGAAAIGQIKRVPSNLPAHWSGPLRSASGSRVFKAGPDNVYLHPLAVGVQVIAGTVLGHLGAQPGEVSGSEPHMLFQIRPSGPSSPLIDPKPILDGWVLLDDTSVFRAKGESPFSKTTPTVGQVLLESKSQLEQQVLRNPGIHYASKCARGDVQTGQVDRRVLATLEFLSVSGLAPTASGLPCGTGSSTQPAGSPAAAGEALDISQVNHISIAGHQGPGSVTNAAIHKLLSLQGTMKPYQITAPARYAGADNVSVIHGTYSHIHVGFMPLYQSSARFARAVNSTLSPHQWIQLIARLGEIPNPTVGNGPSSAAIPDSPAKSEGK